MFLILQSRVHSGQGKPGKPGKRGIFEQNQKNRGIVIENWKRARPESQEKVSEF